MRFYRNSGFTGHMWVEFPDATNATRYTSLHYQERAKNPLGTGTAFPLGWNPKKPDDMYVELLKTRSGVISAGASKGKSCCNANCADIAACLKATWLSYEDSRYVAGFSDCRTHSRAAAKGCCLEPATELVGALGAAPVQREDWKVYGKDELLPPEGLAPHIL